MFEYAVIILLVAAAGFWILRPFIDTERYASSSDPEEKGRLKQLNLKKEGVYAAIKELEFDLTMGKLSEEDFDAMKRQYMLNAVGYLREIDQFQSNKEKAKNLSEEELEQDIEREISALREGGSKKRINLFCTQCGERISPRDRFCFNCGAKLGKT